MFERHDHQIVVGVDGSAESMDAVRWAAAEALLRGRVVRILQAHPPVGPSSGDLPAETFGVVDLAPYEADVFDRACATVSQVAPGVVAERSVGLGRPAQVLIDASDRAAMVVVGHRNRRSGLELGSVAAKVAAHAHCPVVVVSRSGKDTNLQRGLIVVGTDGSSASDAAVGFAFAEADLRTGHIEVIHAWQPPAPPWHTDVRPLVRDVAELETAEEYTVRDWIRPWQDKYPQVATHIRLVCDQPAAVLVRAGSSAELLVVGSHGHGGLAGLVLGSVSQQVLRRACGPVAVVH